MLVPTFKSMILGIRHSIHKIWDSGLDSRDSIFDDTPVMLYTFHRLPTTEYRVSGFGTRKLESTDYRIPSTEY